VPSVAVEPGPGRTYTVRVIGSHGEVPGRKHLARWRCRRLVPQRLGFAPVSGLPGVARVPLAVAIVGHVGFPLRLRQHAEMGFAGLPGIRRQHRRLFSPGLLTAPLRMRCSHAVMMSSSDTLWPGLNLCHGISHILAKAANAPASARAAPTWPFRLSRTETGQRCGGATS
jgi:hypothetical protein